MKLKIVGPTLALLLLVGGVGVSAASNSNNGIPEQIAKLQTTVSNLVNEVTNLLPVKNDVKSVKDELATTDKTVSDQQIEIDSLKKEIADLKSSSSGSVAQITPEVKAGILKAVANNIGRYTSYYSMSGDVVKINVVNYDIKEIDGKEVLQIFTEGNLDWTQSTTGQSDGVGFWFARNFIFNCDPIFKTYGVNLNYEFYQNGEKVTPAQK